MALKNVHLDDKYALKEGQIYITGTQAGPVAFDVRQRDLAHGLLPRWQALFQVIEDLSWGGFDQTSGKLNPF